MFLEFFLPLTTSCASAERRGILPHYWTLVQFYNAGARIWVALIQKILGQKREQFRMISGNLDFDRQ